MNDWTDSFICHYVTCTSNCFGEPSSVFDVRFDCFVFASNGYVLTH
jgi:hypothetical protein